MVRFTGRIVGLKICLSCRLLSLYPSFVFVLLGIAPMDDKDHGVTVEATCDKNAFD